MIPATPEAIGRIVLWLEKLAQLTRSASEPTPNAEGMATYAAMLARSIPSAAFTSDSLLAIAEEHTFFPAFADLRRELQTWWNTTKPSIAPRLTGPADDPVARLKPSDRQWFDRWHKRRAEIRAPGYVPIWGSVERDLESLASLIRDRAPAAWEIIAGKAQQGRSVMTEREREEMADKLEALWRGLGQSLRGKEVPPPVRPAHLSGDALRASRAARGCSVPVPEPAPEPWPEHEEALF